MSGFCVWAGGYSRRVTASDPDEHLEHVAKIGATVVLAATVAALDWSGASIPFTLGLATALRFGIAALMGALGAGIVLTLDRQAVFAMDTRRRHAGVAIYLALRLILVVIVASFTAQVAAPIVMQSELEDYALQMREAADDQRHSKLSRRFELPQRETSAIQATTDRKLIESQADIIPADIQSEFSVEKTCWRRYWTERRNRIASGEDYARIRETMRPLYINCAADRKQANADLTAYHTKMASKLSEAQAEESSAKTDLTNASSEIAAREMEASRIEQKAVGAISSVVLWNLIRSDTGAAIKYLLFVSLILILETLPITGKMLSGRSAVGARIGAARDTAVLDHDTRVQIRQNECRLELEASEIMATAAIQALHSATADTYMQDHFLRQAKAITPLEAARHSLRRIEQQQREIDEMSRRWPQLAGVISEIWQKAIRDTAENLAQS